MTREARGLVRLGQFVTITAALIGLAASVPRVTATPLGTGQRVDPTPDSHPIASVRVDLLAHSRTDRSTSPGRAVALKPCRACGKPVSASAKTCPACGISKPVKTGGTLRWVLLGLGLAVVLVAINGPSTPSA